VQPIHRSGTSWHPVHVHSHADSGIAGEGLVTASSPTRASTGGSS
jgi:hypothetical protein